MAYATGTASNAADLYTKLLTFLTTDSSLVVDGQEWSVVWNTPGVGENPTDIVLMGPGLASDNQVFVGLQLRSDAPSDLYALQSRGMSGYIPSAVSIADQVNVTPNPVRMFLINSPMTYWFVANGRRFVVVAKLSTRYEAMYGGLFLPFGIPTAYPYPEFIGGSSISESVGIANSWTSDHDTHSMFFAPYFSSGITGFATSQLGAQVFSPDGNWLGLSNRGDYNPYSMTPHDSNNYYSSCSQMDILKHVSTSYGGDRLLLPIILYNDALNTCLGELDGIFYAAGTGISAEDIISVGSKNYLIVQNVFRASTSNFMAVRIS